MALVLSNEEVVNVLTMKACMETLGDGCRENAEGHAILTILVQGGTPCHSC